MSNKKMSELLVLVIGFMENPNDRSKLDISILKTDVLIALSDEIKKEYLSSGCDKHDVEAAVDRLMTQCGELFESTESAWTFLMEEEFEG